MASTYSTLAVQLMATGENTTTWGEVTNVNLGTALEEAIVGSANVTFSSGNVTLSLTNTNSAQTARNMRLVCTGTTGGSTRNLIIPTTTGSPPATFEKPYIVQNDCADSIVVKTATGSGVTVPAGKSMWVYANGTDVVEVTTALGSPLGTSSGGTGTNVTTYCNLAANVNGTLPIANGGTGSNATTYCNVETNVTGLLPVLNGGTGSNTASGARTNLSAQETLVSGTNIKTINGTSLLGSGNIDTTTGVIPAGVILLWSGSAASIPAGWVICDGTNGTPNLRDRFVVGAGSTYAVGATGGSANAIVVSHTHTASVTDPGHTHTASVTDPGHTHNLPGSTSSGGINQTQIGVSSTSVNATSATATTGISVTNASNTTGVTVGVSTTGSSATNANLPPYYALCYIMKT